MGLQKFRANVVGTADKNGAVPYYSSGWHVLSLVKNCPTPFGPRTVYLQKAEGDSAFSIPAACSFRKRNIKGYLTSDDNGLTFRPYRSEDSIYPIVLED